MCSSSNPITHHTSHTLENGASSSNSGANASSNSVTSSVEEVVGSSESGSGTGATFPLLSWMITFTW